MIAAGYAPGYAYTYTGNGNGYSGLPRTPSTLREPFLSPASRPTSSYWTPPTPLSGLGGYAGGMGGGGVGGSLGGSAAASHSNLGLMLHAKKEPLPSSALMRKLSSELVFLGVTLLLFFFNLVWRSI